MAKCITPTHYNKKTGAPLIASGDDTTSEYRNMVQFEGSPSTQRYHKSNFETPEQRQRRMKIQ